MKNIMIDIETMGSEESAAILSIGAIIFNNQEPIVVDTNECIEHKIRDGEVVYETATNKPYFYGKASLENNLNRGRTVSASTIEWWLQQDKKAIDEILQYKDASIKNLINDFHYWVLLNIKGDTKIWANGVNFDIKILENAFKQFNLSIPWGYGQICCMRSLRALEKHVPHFVQIKKWHEYKEEMGDSAHNALEDALTQAKYVQNIMMLLNGIRKI